MRNCHIFNGGRGLTSVEWSPLCALAGRVFFFWYVYSEVSTLHNFKHVLRQINVVRSFSFSVTVLAPIALRPGQIDLLPKWASPYCLCSVGLKGGGASLQSAVYSIVNRFKCCIGLSHLQGISNSINRSFNIYSLDGFPPIIYDHQRDVKGDRLFPLWMGLRGTETSPASPLN